MQIGIGLSLTGGSVALLPSLNLDFLSPGFDPRITVTRASTESYYDATGTLQSAANNVSPLDYDPATLLPRGRPVWGQRTNLCLQSEDFSSSWSASPGASVSCSTNQITAPDGATTADKIITNDLLSNSHVWFKSFSGAVSTTYTYSVFLKAAEYSRASIFFDNTAFASTNLGALFDLANGTVVATSGGATAEIQNKGGGWYRCSVTATSDADGGNYIIGLSPKPSAVTDVTGSYTPESTGLGVYAWGSQVEAGSFATPYIPTTSAAATRAADSLVISDLAGIGFNPNEGTFVVECVNQGLLGTAAPRALSMSDGTNSNLIEFYGSTNTSVGFQVFDATVLQANLTQSANASTVNKLAGRYKADSFGASINGAAASTDTSGTVPSVAKMNIGNRQDMARSWNGYIRRIRYWPRALSDAELQAVSA